MEELFNLYKNFFSNTEKKKIKIIMLIFFVISVFESLGILTISPLFFFILDPASLQNNKFYLLISSLNIFDSQKDTIFYYYLFFFIIIFSLNILFRVILIIFINKNNYSIHSNLFEKYINSPFNELNKLDKNVIKKNLTIDINNLWFGLCLPAIYVITSSFIVLMIIMSLFIINFKVTSNLVIVIVSVYFTYKFFLKKKLQFYGALRTLLINKFVFFPNQVFNNLRYVKSIKNKFIQNFVNDYKKNNNMLANLNIFNNLITELPKYIIELCVVIIILTVVIISSGSGELYGPNLSVYGVFGYAFFRLLPHLNLSVRSYLSVKYYLGILKDFSLESDKIGFDKSPESNNLINQDTNELYEFNNSIEFKNVSFKYESNSENILENFDFKILKGEKILIYGDSGTGKTTSVDILLGLISPDTGSIVIDEKIKIDNKNNDSYKKLYSYVPQDILLYYGSLLYNITNEKDTSKIDYNWLKQVIKISNLEKEIDKLEIGYFTKIIDEKSIFSGGQRQRIGIARALYNKPSIIVFDESFSNIHEESTESIIKKIIADQNLTVINISHNSIHKNYFKKIYNFNLKKWE